MDETDPDGGCVSCALGLNRGERPSALEDVPGCFTAAISKLRLVQRAMFTDNRRCLAAFLAKPPIQLI